MRIGIVAPADLPVPAVYGGAIESIIDNLIKENEKYQKNEIVVFSAYDKTALQASRELKRTKIVWLNRGYLYKCLFFVFRVLKKVGLIKVPYNVFYVNSNIKSLGFETILIEGNPIYVEYIKKKNPGSIKVFFHIHAVLRDTDTFLKGALSTADRIIVVSEYLKTDLQRRFPNTVGRVFVLKNCIGNHFFDFVADKEAISQFRNELKIKASDFTILFAGRLVPEKGLLELIRACLPIIPLHNIKIIIIGSFGSGFGTGGSADSLFREIIYSEIKGVEDSFIFTGFIQNHQLMRYYSISDLVVIPSLCIEAAGLVAIESRVCGVPLVITNVGGMPEYVNENCARIIEKDDLIVSKLNEEILRLINNTEELNIMRENTRMEIMQFGPEVYLRKMGELLSE
jgi:glycosyltransferase involved in cell wall biosynthesis